MEAFVTALTTEVGTAELWGALTPMVPVIGITVVFALGYRFIRKGVSGVASGKARI